MGWFSLIALLNFALDCPTQLAQLVADHEKFLVLEVPEGASRSPPHHNRFRPSRSLYYFWPKDKDGRTIHIGLALSYSAKGELLREERVVSQYDEQEGRYRLSFDIEKPGGMDPDEKAFELRRCASCHTAHPRTGRLQIFMSRTSFNLHPEAERWLIQNGE